MPVCNRALRPSIAPVAFTPFSLLHWAYTAFVKSLIKQACSANCFIKHQNNHPTFIENCYKDDNLILRETPLFDTVRALDKTGIYLKHYGFGIFWESNYGLGAEMDRFNIAWLEIYWKARYIAHYDRAHCRYWGDYSNETFEWSDSRYIDDFLLNIDNIIPWCYCSIKHAGFGLQTVFDPEARECYLLEGHTIDCDRTY